MCGIVAMLSRRGEVDGASLQAATAALVHRGPDHRATWIDPTRTLALGHTRLSIIDVAGGNQPLVSEDGAVRLVANGEFYDHRAIRAELAAAGHVLATGSDSEIAVHLYEDLGVRCLDRLRGDFAFALWDARNGVLFAARDRFGLKPLVYAVHRDTLYLASEAKALFAAGVPPRWDRESFHQFVHFFAEPDRTLFENVHQVPPGHYLIATRNGFRIVRYWDVTYPTERTISAARTRDQFVDAFRRELDDAVRLRMLADVPVCVALSGGVDSSAILGLAARHTSAPIAAFTVCYDDDEFSDHRDHDESRIARETAEHAGAAFHPVSVRRADIADHFADTVHHFEWLVDNGNLPSMFILARAMRDAGFKVAVGGEGADEVLAGYSDLRAPSRAAASPGADSALGRVRNVLGFVPELMNRRLAFAARMSPLFRREFAADHAGRDPYLGTLGLLGALPPEWSPLVKAIYLRLKTRFLSYAMPAERITMAHGVELRCPFLDHVLFDLVREMPLSLHQERPEKSVLRDAARPVLTDTVYRRKKWGFQAPPDAPLARDPLHVFTQDTLRSASLGKLPFFDPQSVVAFLDDVSSRDATDVVTARVLRTILSACVLQERLGLG